MPRGYTAAATPVRRHLTRRVGSWLRVVLVALAVLAQVGLVMFLVRQLQDRAIQVYVIIQIIAVIDIFILVGKRQNVSFTIAWVLLILLLPVTGHVLYVLWGRRTKHRRMKRTLTRTTPMLIKNPAVYQNFGETHPERKRLGGYLGRMGFPLYQGTNCKYYPLGDEQFPAMLEDIRNAKRFVFLEYFILSDGRLWQEFRKVLAEKAAEGVEIRVLYDDLGSLFSAPDNLAAELAPLGIQVVAFNPIHYSISRLYINYRNHQKICVIDGDIAYTGGCNLADEYANYVQKFGHWKDAAIRLEGDAVWSMTVFFLQMWEAQTQEQQSFYAYRPQKSAVCDQGFYQPFIDGPMNNPDNPAERMYHSMIYNAREYVYIMSPYLIIDNPMMEALCTAALGGTDVRIITPHHWDKRFVHLATQSNYSTLLAAGVRIYEYTPGYLHAKTVLSDDDHCITGSINMDYRSFFFHYENAVWMCGTPAIQEIKSDFKNTLTRCTEIHLEHWKQRPFYLKLLQGFFRLFAIFL